MTMEDMLEPPINPNFETSHLNDEEQRKIKNFKKDLPSEVFFQPPKSTNHLWAFWSEPSLSPCSGGSITDSATHTPTTNQHIIKSALLHFDARYYERVLIQFWASITTETGCVQLVTSDQPFALTYGLDEGLLNYRKQCLQYKFNVDGEEVGLGIPGRVFRQKWHQYLLDVRRYSTKEYPQRDFALACHISKSFCCPLFQTSSQECVGVLEFAATTFFSLYSMCKSFIKELAGLKTSLCDGLICKVLNRDHHPNILVEIKDGLTVVCATHNLPLAKTWIPCGHFNGLDNSYDTFDVSCLGPAFHYEYKASYLLDDNLKEFFYDSNDFQRGHGVVGSAYRSHELCFCKDITQFSYSIVESPSPPLARSFGLRGCFAICLQTSCTKNYDYILEFFLHPYNTYSEDPSTFLCPILETIKQHFPSFKLASGEELLKELSIKVLKPCMNQEPTSFQCQSTSSPSNGPGVLQNGQEMMQPHSSNQQLRVKFVDLSIDWHVVDAEQNNGQEKNNVPITRPDETCMNHEPDFSQCQSSISPPRLEVSHNRQETTWPHPPNQQLIDEVEVDDINDGRNVNANSITYEELEKHFGKKLEDVTEIFGVSRSTFKRICRDKKIDRWPRSKRKKVEGYPCRREPPCSNLTAKKFVATDAHMTPRVRPPPEARAMTIKATYGDDMIKFDLSFSSRMVELNQEVSERLKLNVGTYKIKYLDDADDQILITGDKDLQYCMSASNSLGMNTIKMFIEPITKISPSTS